MKLNAVTYARFSSNNQREASIEIQQEHIYRYCKDNGITIIKDYVDRAMSATSDNRPEFQQMIKDAESGLFSFVVVYNSSRFCRNIQDHLKYKAILEMYGVRIISVNENFDETTPEGDLMSNFMMSINQYYSKDLSRKTYLGCMETAKNGKHVGGVPLYGYDVIDQKYIINEQEAKAVRLIFEMVAQGYSNKEICDELDKYGYKRRNGSNFQAKFSTMLRNRKYIGEFVWNQFKRSKLTGKVCVKDPSEIVRIPDVIPPLISKELFEKVQSILDGRGYRKENREIKSIYLLQSMIVCGCCGYTVSVDCNRNGNGKNSHTRTDYRCYSRNKRRAECDVKPYRMDYTDAYVLNLVNCVLLNERYARNIYKLIVDKIGKGYTLTKSELLENQKNQIKIRDEMRRLVNSLPDARPIVYQEILNEIERMKLELTELERKGENLKENMNNHSFFSEDTIQRRITELKGAMGKKTVAEIKDVLKLLIKKIQITNEEFVVVVNINAYLPKNCKQSLEIVIVEEPINIKDRNHHLEQKLNWTSLNIRI